MTKQGLELLKEKLEQAAQETRRLAPPQAAPLPPELEEFVRQAAKKSDVDAIGMAAAATPAPTATRH